MKLYKVGAPQLHEPGEYCAIGKPCLSVYLASEVDAARALEEGVQMELRERIQELKKQLAFANDAAAKGENARQEAGGMQMRIEELTKALREAAMWVPGGSEYSDGPPLLKRIDALLGR